MKNNGTKWAFLGIIIGIFVVATGFNLEQFILNLSANDFSVSLFSTNNVSFETIDWVKSSIYLLTTIVLTLAIGALLEVTSEVIKALYENKGRIIFVLFIIGIITTAVMTDGTFGI